MQAIAPEILIIRHFALPLILLLSLQFPPILAALIRQIAQMARRPEIPRRVQDPVEEAVGVEEEDPSLRVRGAKVGGEAGEAGVPGGDGFGQWGLARLVGAAVEGRHV